MRRGYRLWTDDDMVELAELLAAGVDRDEIARRLGRSREAINVRVQRVLCPIEGNRPKWGRKPMGVSMYWTRERTLEGLRAFVAEHRGTLPSSDHVYNDLKKGRMDWPTSAKVLEYFGTMADAWAAAGAPRSRYRRDYVPWSQEDDDYLLEHAGEQTLKLIAKRLGRGWAACKRRLYDLGAGRARDVSGHLSAAQVAQEFGCPLSRVQALIARGELKARKVVGGHYWRIEPEDLEPVRERLQAPKRKSYKGRPPDLGDYERRYGLRRKVVNGRVVRVRVAS